MPRDLQFTLDHTDRDDDPNRSVSAKTYTPQTAAKPVRRKAFSFQT